MCAPLLQVSQTFEHTVDWSSGLGLAEKLRAECLWRDISRDEELCFGAFWGPRRDPLSKVQKVMAAGGRDDMCKMFFVVITMLFFHGIVSAVGAPHHLLAFFSGGHIR